MGLLRRYEINRYFPDLTFPKTGNSIQETADNFDFWKMIIFSLCDGQGFRWLEYIVYDTDFMKDPDKRETVKKIINTIFGDTVLKNKLTDKDITTLEDILNYLDPDTTYTKQVNFTDKYGFTRQYEIEDVKPWMKGKRGRPRKQESEEQTKEQIE